MAEKIIVIDEGTTSTRTMLFAADGTPLGSAQREIGQHYPGAGLVEHDAAEIWEATVACTREMIAQAGGADHVAAIGITNQRETVVFWDRASGEPLAPAIVWQDRRSAADCAALKEAGHEPMAQQRSGLLLDPYFSGTKIGWGLKNWPQLAQAGDRLAVGTIESYLVYRLTGGVHITDATNASRTLLMNINGAGGWDDELCDLLGVPMALLPEITGCTTRVGTTDPALFGGAIPICGMAGDQQAATIGQACLSPGQTKATFGTGAFILSASGTRRPVSANRLLATVLVQEGDIRSYALEGSVFVAGSLIKWLRDGLGLLASASESEGLARSVADNGGVYLVPALTGLGAPHWRPDALAALSGLSFATGKAHVARAALEAQAYQANDLKCAFAADGVDWADLRIDGGMAANDWMAQDLSDMLDLTVERPDFVESTALGAAMLAATGAGLYPDLASAATAMRGTATRFTPAVDPQKRKTRLAGWQSALAKVLG
ncbi:glycerol kinase [Sphingopyxis sp. RIFCSPHIGHO2_12_FULL_65_19]|uniref:glycerol kinase n=1 Tax=Sphingopyxis sp. RIFCSPHIGHO2_12_FULL_65_19 TaxID=1802172 RepID=UPI0008D8C92D|nr:glycerol kinase [Sphingopyxis sp. RIFCSPHIGHO2_12_FULL_65_19]OHD05745.1 MAG: glycerol kinase [Sphingopyxis sp. RIFCSPHIGHO2_12_FULL_65_19]